MSYAGVCADQDLQSSADAMFNAGAYAQMARHITQEQGAGCEDQIMTGNSAPTVEAGGNFTIPRDTPFKLTAVVDDAEQSTAELTTSWEQYSLGSAWTFDTILPNSDQQDGNTRPILRVFLPSSSPVRTVPRLANILDGTYENNGEDLPSISQVMTFRATVRDNAAGGGGVSSDDMRLTVESNAGPFRVISHGAEQTLKTGETTVVRWDVASTNVAPIYCRSVNIALSVDGGDTFDQVMKMNVENNGEAVVLIPSSAFGTTSGRIQVACSNNIFFDISKADITIEEGEPIVFTDVIYLPNVVR